MHTIRFSRIAKFFHRRRLLDNLSLALTAGEVILLCGENGAGKTTLLKIICGLEKPADGAADFGRGEQPWKKCRARLQQHIMYMHQRPYLFAGSVSRNLGLALPRALTSTRRDEKIRRGLAWARMETLSRADAKTLSGGEAQRLALTRAWLRQSKFLLLDEPVANLDTASQFRTVELLRRLKNAGVGMIIAGHRAEIFNELADRHMRLADGKLKCITSA